MGWETSLSRNENATISNAGSRSPILFQPRLPPLSCSTGSAKYFFANTSQLIPCFNFCSISEIVSRSLAKDAEHGALFYNM